MESNHSYIRSIWTEEMKQRWIEVCEMLKNSGYRFDNIVLVAKR